MDDIQKWVIVANRKLPSAVFFIEFTHYHLHVVTGIGLHIIEYSTGAYFLKRGIIPSDAIEEELSNLVLESSQNNDGDGSAFWNVSNNL